MPRKGQGIDPERVRRAALAYMNGECDRASAAERANVSKAHITDIVQRLRRERAAAREQPPPHP